jgi:hypothetical protein
LKKTIYIILFIYSLLAALTILFFNGTGDAGDSIQHYLYAKYAPVHPELFFHHWAKPMYVLLASPFAQFGFTGVKIFNAIASFFTIFLTYKTAEALNLKNTVLAAVIAICAPMYYILTFSGLTEPLFALFIGAGIYACVKEKYLTATLLISFLPFVRSEGLILLGIFGLYLLVKGKYKLAPLLLTGHIVYSLAGFFVYHDLLWVFTRIPYATVKSQYGSGGLFDFATGLIYVIGVPIYILFLFGVISVIVKSVKKKISPELLILVFGGLISFLVAHSLFWYFGIFGSMGLKRVMIGVMPMVSIIALEGFNFITEAVPEKRKKIKLIFQGALTGYIVIFPFTHNPAAINWERDMNLSKDQQAAIQTVNFITQRKGKDHRFIYSHPYLSETFNIDCFDVSRRSDMSIVNTDQLKQGDIIIWESWFAPVENGIGKEKLDNNPKLVNFFHTSVNDNGREITYSAYELK